MAEIVGAPSLGGVAHLLAHVSFRPGEGVEGLFVLAQPVVGLAQFREGRGAEGHAGVLQAPQPVARRRRLALAPLDAGQHDGGGDVLAIQGQGFSRRLAGFAAPVEGLQGPRQAGMGIGVLGLQLDGGAQVVQGLAGTVHVAQKEADGTGARGVAGPQPAGAVQVLKRVIEAPQVLERHAQAERRIEAGRVKGRGLAEGAGRLFQSSGGAIGDAQVVVG